MNMVDRLLKADVVNKLAERPEKKVKMERLSKLFGFDFIITLRAIDPERYADIQKMAVDFTNGSADNIDIYQMQTQTLLAGIADPDLKNKDLLEKFGAVLPGDIIRKLFLAGEIADLTARRSLLGKARFSSYSNELQSYLKILAWKLIPDRGLCFPMVSKLFLV